LHYMPREESKTEIQSISKYISIVLFRIVAGI
jgi:hypothetical protein